MSKSLDFSTWVWNFTLMFARPSITRIGLQYILISFPLINCNTFWISFFFKSFLVLFCATVSLKNCFSKFLRSSFFLLRCVYSLQIDFKSQIYSQVSWRSILWTIVILVQHFMFYTFKQNSNMFFYRKVFVVN